MKKLQEKNNEQKTERSRVESIVLYHSALLSSGMVVAVGTFISAKETKVTLSLPLDIVT